MASEHENGSDTLRIIKAYERDDIEYYDYRNAEGEREPTAEDHYDAEQDARMDAGREDR